MVYGFSTSDWGAQWETADLVETLAEAEITAVELHVGHAHKISPAMSPQLRSNLRDSFMDSNLTVIGCSLEAKLDVADQGDLMTQVDNIKQQIKLSHDIGGSGVTLKGGIFSTADSEIKDEAIEKTAELLKGLGSFAVGFGQEIRVEVAVDGSSESTLKVLKKADADNVRATLRLSHGEADPAEVEKVFKAYAPLLAQTVAIGSVESGNLGFDKLAALLVDVDYSGVIVLHGDLEEMPADITQGLVQQKGIWSRAVYTARKK